MVDTILLVRVILHYYQYVYGEPINRVNNWKPKTTNALLGVAKERSPERGTFVTEERKRVPIYEGRERKSPFLIFLFFFFF